MTERARLGDRPRGRAARFSEAPGDLSSAGEQLTEFERAVLDFAGKTWRYAGARDVAIRETFDMSGYRFQQITQGLLDRPEALAYAPVTVNRLQRLRDRNRAARSARVPGTIAAH
jgi:hypothetical protein